MSEDDEFLLPSLRGTIYNEVVMLKLGLDHLKFISSANGVEIVSLGHKLSFIKFFHFWSILSYVTLHFSILQFLLTVVYKCYATTVIFNFGFL